MQYHHWPGSQLLSDVGIGPLLNLRQSTSGLAGWLALGLVAVGKLVVASRSPQISLIDFTFVICSSVQPIKRHVIWSTLASNVALSRYSRRGSGARALVAGIMDPKRTDVFSYITRSLHIAAVCHCKQTVAGVFPHCCILASSGDQTGSQLATCRLSCCWCQHP